MIIPTYNKAATVSALVTRLTRQALEKNSYEIIVVNDGSKDDSAARLADLVADMEKTYPGLIKVINQINSGVAIARHAGVMGSSGEILLFLDDDMDPADEEFLSVHLAAHDLIPSLQSVVLGSILPPKSNLPRPAFEYMYEDHIALKYLAFDKGVRKPGGADLYTANVSMPKSLYLLVGGFDPTYKHGEDRELGIRLEVNAFAQFVYRAEARAYHNSATGRFSSFVSRAFNYGKYDYLMSLRYPSRKDLSPFQYLVSDSLLMRLTICTTLQAPRLTAALCVLLVALARFFSWLQWRVIAIALCKIIYKANYIQGLRLAIGSQNLIPQLKLWKSTSP